MIDYTTTLGADGLPITSADQVSKLSATPPDFQAYVQLLFAHPPAPSCNTPFALSVLGVDTRGFAAGAWVTCQPSEAPNGEVSVLWAKVDGQWRDIQAYGTWGLNCAVLAQYRVPVTVLPQSPDCFTDPNNQNTDRPYNGPQ